MFQKIKDAWLFIIGGLGAIIGILWFILKSKGDRIDELNAKIMLATTEREADLIEVEIKQMMQEKKLLKKELDEFDNSLLLLKEHRRKLRETEEAKSSNEIEDYWNN